jgi:CheY-like chemotaxis protein
VVVRRVLAVVPDLFFAARIAEVARNLRIEVEQARADTVVARARTNAPALIVVDLHAPGAIDAVRGLRSDPAIGPIEVIGFYSHVDQATRAAAEAAGITRALPRSAFTAQLARLLAGE